MTNAINKLCNSRTTNGDKVRKSGAATGLITVRKEY